MTEQDWLACTDPMQMLAHLWRKASQRKLRLFACASCRMVWHQKGEAAPDLVGVSERFADGEVSEEQFRAVRREITGRGGVCARFEKSNADNAVLEDEVVSAAIQAIQCYFLNIKEIRKNSPEAAFISRLGEAQELADLFRDIFGNPSRLVTIDQIWHSANVIALAQAIYDDRAFDRLPILADAVEEAGCDNADILSHCRREGPHVRGCWVVDLILGKE